MSNRFASICELGRSATIFTPEVSTILAREFTHCSHSEQQRPCIGLYSWGYRTTSFCRFLAPIFYRTDLVNQTSKMKNSLSWQVTSDKTTLSTNVNAGHQKKRIAHSESYWHEAGGITGSRWVLHLQFEPVAREAYTAHGWLCSTSKKRDWSNYLLWCVFETYRISIAGNAARSTSGKSYGCRGISVLLLVGKLAFFMVKSYAREWLIKIMCQVHQSDLQDSRFLS